MASASPASSSSAMSPSPNTTLPVASSAAPVPTVAVDAGAAPARNAGTSSIEDALEWMRKGGFVVVMDNEDRENEGDLIATAESATEEAVAFMLRHTTGIVCVPALASRLHNELQLPLMVENNTEVHKCKFTVTVDLREGNSTGVSAADRARTIRALADSTVAPSAFNRPGHIFPLVAQDGGVLVRAGHTEAAVDLARLAGAARPVGYICEMNDEHGRMMRRPQLETFATHHGLPLITISDLIRYRVRTEKLVERLGVSKRIATPLGEFVATEYKSLVHDGGAQRYDVLVYGDVSATPRDVAVYFVEDGFAHSVQAQWAQKQIAEAHAAGVLIYVNDSKKLLEISGELMARQSMFGMGMQIVRDLGVETVVLLTSERDAKLAFDPHGFGVAIARVEAVATGL
jgi:3,4-dihydroxy 2-butanone 4-phosphate synthase / GTP cyclohydrolase II